MSFSRFLLLPLLLPFSIASAQTPAPLPARAAVDLALSNTQVEKAKIELRSLGEIDANRHGNGNAQAIRLPGMVVLPLDAQEIISIPASGTVQAILTPPSQPVRAGQPLLRLYSPQLLQWQREFIQAAAQEKLATEKLKRDTALFAEGIIAETRLQEARSTATQSRAQASEAAQMLRLVGMSDKAIQSLRNTQKLSASLEITARMDGIVLEYGVVPGQQVEAGAALAKLAQNGRLWVELNALRQQAAQARVGNRIRFASCPDEALVIAVSPQVKADNQTVLIRGELNQPSSCLSVNQYVEATLYLDRSASNSWAVPATAIIRHENTHWIFVRTAHGFTALPVTVISSADGLTHIRSGVPAGTAFAPGTRIAVSGTAVLKGALLGIGMEEETPPEAPQPLQAQGGSK
ncbi:MAG: efflux RND transporter periplasmic adaptor subunit [Azoarcus sp.]|jgi:multidrug efflux pump subunit AcrA (membrane-fusion protein)|nr:efflux RND transporter periplasmic adaptor subunit [Azoarcus sp.]